MRSRSDIVSELLFQNPHYDPVTLEFLVQEKLKAERKKAKMQARVKLYAKGQEVE